MIIISRCPYRVSLLGGSSDLDWYVNDSGEGIALGFAIKLYSRVILALRESHQKGILNYSSREEYKDINSISHPIIRSCFKRFNIQKKLELISIGETFSGTGLGSSSSFTVALIKALSELNNIHKTNTDIAHLASEIEIKDLKKKIGRQDQYLCSLGGSNILKFQPNGKVTSLNNSKIKESISDFSKNLYLIDTKITRNATKKLSDIEKQTNSKILINDLFKIANKFIEKSYNLNRFEIQDFLIYSMKKSWLVKKKIFGVMSKELNEIENCITKNNFCVLKLLGAGGGGFFLATFQGNDFEKSKKDLISKGLSLREVTLSEEGCSSCIF